MSNEPTPAELLQRSTERMVDEMARQEAAGVASMGPGQRHGIEQTVRIFERVKASHNVSIALCVVVRLGVMQVLRDPALTEKMGQLARAGETGIIRG